jgi:hypothetical protein
MVPHNDHLESELRRLRPRAPSPQLKQRIAAELDGTTHENDPVRGRVLAFPSLGFRLAAAAVLLALVGVPLFRMLRMEPGTGASTVAAPVEKKKSLLGVYQPVMAKRTLVHREDDGVVSVNGYGPLRKVRYHTLNHMEWKNPETGRTFAITAPQENIVFVKLNSY